MSEDPKLSSGNYLVSDGHQWKQVPFVCDECGDEYTVHAHYCVAEPIVDKLLKLNPMLAQFVEETETTRREVWEAFMRSQEPAIIAELRAK